MARIAFWTSGEHDDEALDFTGNHVYWHHGIARPSDSLDAEFQGLFAALKVDYLQKLG
jgi:hypothetical protein